MIRNEQQVERTRERIREFESDLERTRDAMASSGYDARAVEVATAGTVAIVDDLRAQVGLYERLLREGVRAVSRMPPMERGKELIALRIASRVTEAELAERLGITEGELVRSEENDHFSVSADFFERVLVALEVEQESARYSPRKYPFTIDLPRMTLRAACFDPRSAASFRLTGSS